MKLKSGLSSHSIIFLFLLVVFSACGLQIGVNSQSVSAAWCTWGDVLGDYDDVSEQGADQCIKDSWDSIPTSAGDHGLVRRGVPYSDYIKFINNCSNVFNTTVACGNAVTNCLQTALDISTCGDADSMRDVAGLSCNFGRTLGCGVMGDQVSEAIQETRGDIVKNVRADVNCDMSGVDTSKIADVQRRQSGCENNFNEKAKVCAKPQSAYDNGRYYNDVQADLDKYRKCMNTAYIESAANEHECNGRTGGQGIYMDKSTQDPRGPNKLGVGCFRQATDLTNPEACRIGAEKTGRNFKWQRTDKPPTPATEAWGCVDPDNPDGVDDDEDKTTKGPGGKKITESTKTCGAEARVNLLECENEGGSTALGNILRVFVIVLSFGVGIAAVGGLAFSAIQYAGASDNQGNVSAARERIRNIVIGLLLYGFLIAISNWLVPGGVL